MTKTILGHIDCPACGAANGMRITHDKNSDPFGFCEVECGQQLRVGGSVRRVRAFVARFPWAAAIPVTGTVTAPAAPAPVAAPAPAPARPAAPPVPKPPAPKPAPAPPAPVKKAAWFQPIIGSKHG